MVKNGEVPSVIKYMLSLCVQPNLITIWFYTNAAIAYIPSHCYFIFVCIAKVSISYTCHKIFYFSQLRYDGLDMVAANLAKCVGLETTPLSPSSRLLGLMKLGLQEEKNGTCFSSFMKCCILQICYALNLSF